MHYGRGLGERPSLGDPALLALYLQRLRVHGDGRWCRRKAQMYKRSLSHLFKREHSGTVRGMTCWRTVTLTHTYIHTPVNVSLAATATHPRTHSCTGMRSQALTLSLPSQPPPHTTSHGLLLTSFLQPWPFRGVKALFSSNTLIHPSPVL